ncbi:MAG: hypothetical protein WD467_01950 [Candidatus Saccharimonadales bacterium]
METNDSHLEIDPRQDALEEVAFIVWQFAAAWQQVSFHDDMKPVRQPSHDERLKAAELMYDFDLTADEVDAQARSFYQETVEILYPTDGLDPIQRELTLDQRDRQYLNALWSINGAIRTRILQEREA